MSNNTETGAKWWLRYVVVPIIGGGGIIAIMVALITGRSSSTADQPSPTRAIIANASPSVAPAAQGIVWPQTGQSIIDWVHRDLNERDPTKTADEAHVTAALRRLFGEPFFRQISEEVPPTMLFVLIRAHILMDYYRQIFPEPTRREAMLQADMKVLKLLGHIEKLYPAGFSVQTSCQDVLNDFDSFKGRLPRIQGSRTDPTWEMEAQEILAALNGHLKKAGLAD
jgi:hypothetical protein